MNLNEEKYAKFGLVKDMMAAVDIVKKFNCDQAIAIAGAIKKARRLMLTGEGSSRIFPAKNVMCLAAQKGWKLHLATAAARQSMEYNLKDWAVFAASNSGKTSEVIKLFQQLSAAGHQQRYALTANATTQLEALSNQGYVLACGPESAVAATKSVIAQALFYQALIEHAVGKPRMQKQVEKLSAQVHQALTLSIDPALVARIASAPTIYFSGRNDGVAEELTLKTNEITRRKSDFMEGTYAVHGVEEVMDAGDVVIIIDPYPDYEAKFQEVLASKIGLTIISIADHDTSFPTIRIPRSQLPAYVQMAAGWNLLVEVGVKLHVDLDHPVRARKVGNEFVTVLAPQ